MDISYNIIIGVANITWLITSGGVKMAAATNEVKIAYRLLEANPSGVTNPDFTSNNNTTGSSKLNPNANINLITSDKYSDILGSTSIGKAPWPGLISKDRKNCQAKGITM